MAWQAQGYEARRLVGSKPYDFWVMGGGLNLMCEAKNWKDPPTEAYMRKEYQWLKEYAEKRRCHAWCYVKQGRGKNNYMIYKLN